MEEKYKSYTEFNWAGDDKWQTYLKNFYPVPPANKLEIIRRKWYKKNHDKDFDIEYLAANLNDLTPQERRQREESRE